MIVELREIASLYRRVAGIREYVRRRCAEGAFTCIKDIFAGIKTQFRTIFKEFAKIHLLLFKNAQKLLYKERLYGKKPV